MANYNDIAELGRNAESAAVNFGNMAAAISKSVAETAQSIAGIGTAINSFVNKIIDGINIATAAIATFASSVVTGISAVSQVLPTAGAAIMMFAVSLSGLLGYIPELALFIASMSIFSLIGDGLLAAGQGILFVGQGMALMSANIPILVEGLTLLIEQFAAIGEYIIALIGIVLVSAAMYVLAAAMQKINDQIVPLNKSFEQLKAIASAGFIAGIGVLLVFVLGLSASLSKTADGIDKVTAAMKKQSAQLAVLNPLLAAQAVLKEPISGAITVALAIASAALVSALMPAMATGGVVDSPTIALVGEGRYPEAVVPLGDSPQFTNMKSDIASTVAEFISGMQQSNNAQIGDIVINIDGREFARAQFNNFKSEAQRRGVKW